MKQFFIISILFCLSQNLFAQQVNNDIATGNDAYKKGDFNTAIESYKKALRSEPENNTARFNLANALQRKNESEESIKDYDAIINKTNDNTLKADANYNKALVYVKEKDLQHAVSTFKSVLKENPADNNARENLQKAMDELKKQQQQNQPQPKKQQQQNPQQQKQQQLNKDMMQQKFNELHNQEKQLQKKLQTKQGNGQPDKDW